MSAPLNVLRSSSRLFFVALTGYQSRASGAQASCSMTFLLQPIESRAYIANNCQKSIGVWNVSRCLNIFCFFSTFNFFSSDGEVMESVHVRMLGEDEESKSTDQFGPFWAETTQIIHSVAKSVTITLHFNCLIRNENSDRLIFASKTKRTFRIKQLPWSYKVKLLRNLKNSMSSPLFNVFWLQILIVCTTKKGTN